MYVIIEGRPMLHHVLGFFSKTYSESCLETYEYVFSFLLSFQDLLQVRLDMQNGGGGNSGSFTLQFLFQTSMEILLLQSKSPLFCMKEIIQKHPLPHIGSPFYIIFSMWFCSSILRESLCKLGSLVESVLSTILFPLFLVR